MLEGFLRMPRFATALTLAVFTTCAFLPMGMATSAQAQDLVFMLDNQSSYDVREFYASPTDVDNWEEDILGADILPAGSAMRVTVADGREQCTYDLRIVFSDGDVAEDTSNLCETGSFTITD
jgi:hypothetical protein